MQFLQIGGIKYCGLVFKGDKEEVVVVFKLRSEAFKKAQVFISVRKKLFKFKIDTQPGKAENTKQTKQSKNNKKVLSMGKQFLDHI